MGRLGRFEACDEFTYGCSRIFLASQEGPRVNDVDYVTKLMGRYPQGTTGFLDIQVLAKNDFRGRFCCPGHKIFGRADTLRTRFSLGCAVSPGEGKVGYISRLTHRLGQVNLPMGRVVFKNTGVFREKNLLVRYLSQWCRNSQEQGR